MKSLTLAENSGYTITVGILLIILGVIVIGAQVFTTFFSVFLLGWGLIMGGVAQFVLGVFSGSWSKFFLALIGGVINFTFGLILVLNPELSVATIALLMGILLLVGGAYKAIAAIIAPTGQRGWVFTAGLVSLLLGVSILAQWPYSGSWVIGLFIGIELLVSGFALILSTIESGEEVTTEQVTVRQATYLSGAKGGESKKEVEN